MAKCLRCGAGNEWIEPIGKDCPECARLKELDHPDLVHVYIPASERCPQCGGVGHRCYPSTATWRGGIGGQALTTDVCDKCWGSGSIDRTGTDLRKMYGAFRTVEKERDAALAERDEARKWADETVDAVRAERDALKESFFAEHASAKSAEEEAGRLRDILIEARSAVEDDARTCEEHKMTGLAARRRATLARIDSALEEPRRPTVAPTSANWRRWPPPSLLGESPEREGE